MADRDASFNAMEFILVLVAIFIAVGGCITGCMHVVPDHPYGEAPHPAAAAIGAGLIWVSWVSGCLLTVAAYGLYYLRTMRDSYDE